MTRPPAKYDLARKLRRQMSPAETRLWVRLRNRETLGFNVRRSYAFGPYILDFYCDKVKLCIEVDGGQHSFDEARVYDEKRDAYLKSQDIDTLRIPAIQVMEDPYNAAQYVVDDIRLRLDKRSV
jgi:very-short-patch-repair endonuclease